MAAINFTVYGKAAPKGSVKAFVPRRRDGSIVSKPDGSPVVVKTDDSGDRGGAWMGDVSKACAEEMAANGVELLRDVPVSVGVDFLIVRPKSHYGTGRNATVLKASAPERPASRPDVDKLARAVLDALKGTAYADDGQVVELHARKLFGDQARAEVEVEMLVVEPLTLAV